MRHSIVSLLACVPMLAQTPDLAAGAWISDLQWFDRHNWQRLTFSAAGNRLTGKYGESDFSGVLRDGAIEGSAKSGDSVTTFRGRFTGDRITGTAQSGTGENRRDFSWEYRRLPVRAAPRIHSFAPTVFQHHFAENLEPVLRVATGDTVKTWSVDAGGTDSKGVRRTSGGNPLTGPFFIDGAVPGDTLVVRFSRIRLNRDSAVSAPLITDSALEPWYAAARKPVKDYDADWKLDLAAGFATPHNPSEKLKGYRVPLSPMLGCVGVAPGRGNQYRSGALGAYGGNMDYNQLREGTTVYLPVNVPGALLFIGDGHAAQGAGELNGDALETSMDIEFSVDVIPNRGLPGPRFENDGFLMASGIAGSLDDAFRGATTNLVRWLEERYGLNANEVSSVVSTAVVYDIAEIVDTQDHVVARIPKSAIASLQPVNR